MTSANQSVHSTKANIENSQVLEIIKFCVASNSQPLIPPSDIPNCTPTARPFTCCLGPSDIPNCTPTARPFSLLTGPKQEVNYVRSADINRSMLPLRVQPLLRRHFLLDKNAGYLLPLTGQTASQVLDHLRLTKNFNDCDTEKQNIKRVYIFFKNMRQ